MSPKAEFKDLLTRSRRLLDAALLLIITFALLAVAAGTLLCTVFVTTFSTGSYALNKMTERVHRPKEEAFDAL